MPDEPDDGRVAREGPNNVGPTLDLRVKAPSSIGFDLPSACGRRGIAEPRIRYLLGVTFITVIREAPET
jgi:hypothetical protein